MKRYPAELALCEVLEAHEKKRIITPRGTYIGYVELGKAIVPFIDWIEVYDKKEFAIGED